MRRPAGRKRPDAGAWFQHIAPRFARHHAAGGQHRPLREREIRAIYDAALRLLADLGIGEVPETLAQMLDTGGCTDNGRGCWMFPGLWSRMLSHLTFARLAHNIPVSCITAAQSGTTAPANIAGFLAQSLAETRASLVTVNLVKPGHSMVFSNQPLVIDLRTGTFAGSGETTVQNAALVQASNWLGLQSGVAVSVPNA